MKASNFDRTYIGTDIVRLLFVLVLLISANLLSAQTLSFTKQTTIDTGLVEDTRSVSVPSWPDSSADSKLPDAPGEAFSPAAGSAGITALAVTQVGPYHPPPVATLYDKYISPGQKAQSLTTSKKLFFGIHELVSPYLLLSVATAAGYEHAVNGSPNYGTDSGAYGQRVGAAAIRDASQAVFSDSIMATVLHEDPRYYEMGNSHGAFARAGYAVSRVLVTRSDDGGPTPNYSLLSGYAGAAALENAYYPADNQGASETAKSFAGSLGGAALSNVIREFLPDILHAVHLER